LHARPGILTAPVPSDSCPRPSAVVKGQLHQDPQLGSTANENPDVMPIEVASRPRSRCERVRKSVDKDPKTMVSKTADGTEHTIKWNDDHASWQRCRREGIVEGSKSRQSTPKKAGRKRRRFVRDLQSRCQSSQLDKQTSKNIVKGHKTCNQPLRPRCATRPM